MPGSDFTPHVENIGNIFGRNDNWFEIPRYQRDYAWGNDNIKTFYKDIVSHIEWNKDENQLKPSPYFLGTILLHGKWDNSHEAFDVIDGQQRLTTMYLFLGALMRRADEQRKDKKNNQSPEEIKSLDIFSNRILNQDLKTQELVASKVKNTVNIDTGNNVMEHLVFDEGDKWLETRPCCDAEQHLIDAYRYFYDKLAPNALSKSLDCPDDMTVTYASRLMAMYEQVMYPTVIIIAVTSEHTINEIFEAINSKGRHLEDVDLIKNAIFNSIGPQPHDNAKEDWAEIKRNLSKKSSNDGDRPWLSIDKFFSVFWNATQQKVSGNLYANYLMEYGNESSDKDSIDKIKKFLQLAKDYSKIFADMNGLSNYLCFHKEYREYIKADLTAMRDLKFTQTTPLVSVLVWAYENRVLSARDLLKILDYLLAYSIVCSLSKIHSNKLTMRYRKWTRKLFLSCNSSSKGVSTKKVRDAINEMQVDLASVLPSWNKEDVIRVFRENEQEYSYTNKTDCDDYDRKNQTRVRSILRILYINNVDKWDAPSNFKWNVEHILPDKNISWSETHQIGNLLWLEKQINTECKNDNPEDKTIRYKDSRNPEANKLLGNNFLQRVDNAKNDSEIKRLIDDRSYEIILDLYQFARNKKTNMK